MMKRHILCLAVLIGVSVFGCIGYNTHFVKAQDNIQLFQMQNKNQLEEVNQEVAEMHLQVEQASQLVQAEQAEIERIRLEEQKARELEALRANSREMNVTLTYYTAAADEGSGTGITASGTYATAGRTIACNFLPIGTKVEIEGNVYIVEDRGGMSGNVIDVFVNTKAEAFALGRRHATVHVLDY